MSKVKKVRVCVLRTAGTNCDRETHFAFSLAGAVAELVHINSFISAKRHLEDFHILAIPGGFTYGDDVAAGKILANELRYKMIDQLRAFIQAGKLIIGICNGFQVLVKSGLLPGNRDLKCEVTLTVNDSAKFEDRWVYLKTYPEKTCCVWTKNIDEIIYLPVAHGEGKFISSDQEVLNRLKKNGQIVFQYCDAKGSLSGYPDNPNGSEDNVAGICDETGRILGLMPHPERHISFLQHPHWAKINKGIFGCGLRIFKNAVDYVLEKF